MAKKYLNLEEAAQHLGISVDELKKYREDGDIRGFADRGAWKFRMDDVDKFSRSLNTDSAPEVPLLDGGDSESIFDEEDYVGAQPTVVRGSDEPDEAGSQSDSDVRLVDSSGESSADSGFDIPLLTDSDSDVRLIDDSTTAGADSDSDVKLVSEGSDSDSDVRIAPGSETEGELDLLASDSYSDSDIRLIDDSDTRAEPAPTDSDSATQMIGDTGASGSGILGLAPADSGISLEADSGIPLAADSGISLEVADSGITLETTGSDLGLGGMDSGLSLADDDDDAITLAADSGISLEPQSNDDMYQTIPMLDASGAEGGGDSTHVEVPALEDQESEFEIDALDDDDAGSDSNELMFDDDDASEATVVHDPGDEEFDLDGEYDDDLEVADDDLLGEDDELDVFDADDDDFDDGFESGQSHSDFVAAPAATVAAVEADWGVGTFVGLILSASLMCVCCIVVFDLVQSMWAWQEPTGFNSALLDALRDLF